MVATKLGGSTEQIKSAPRHFASQVVLRLGFLQHCDRIVEASGSRRRQLVLFRRGKLLFGCFDMIEINLSSAQQDGRLVICLAGHFRQTSDVLRRSDLGGREFWPSGVTQRRADRTSNPGRRARR